MTEQYSNKPVEADHGRLILPDTAEFFDVVVRCNYRVPLGKATKWLASHFLVPKEDREHLDFTSGLENHLVRRMFAVDKPADREHDRKPS